MIQPTTADNRKEIKDFCKNSEERVRCERAYEGLPPIEEELTKSSNSPITIPVIRYKLKSNMKTKKKNYSNLCRSKKCREENKRSNKYSSFSNNKDPWADEDEGYLYNF